MEKTKERKLKKVLTSEAVYSIIQLTKEREVLSMTINNKPDYAKDYEFIVARECDGEYWFWGAYENSFDAERIALEIGGVVFYNAIV